MLLCNVMCLNCDDSSDPRGIKMFVLDEADEMLSRGFKDQIYDVFKKLPSSIQVKIFVVNSVCCV